METIKRERSFDVWFSRFCLFSFLCTDERIWNRFCQFYFSVRRWKKLKFANGYKKGRLLRSLSRYLHSGSQRNPQNWNSVSQFVDTLGNLVDIDELVDSYFKVENVSLNNIPLLMRLKSVLTSGLMAAAMKQKTVCHSQISRPGKKTYRTVHLLSYMYIIEDKMYR